MITFTVVVLKELANCITQRSLTEENQSAKALFLHRSHEPRNMSVEIGRSLWQSQTGETICLKDRSKTAVKPPAELSLSGWQITDSGWSISKD